MKHLAAATAFVSLVASGGVQAADLPVKAPIVAPVPYSWTGCFIGIAGGGVWGRSRHISGDATTYGFNITNRYTMDGGIVGVEYGCNWQTGRWVLGTESDFSWTSLSGSANNILPFNTTSVSGTREHWLSTSRVRVGFLATDTLLLYATGGLATGRIEANVNAIPAGFGIITESRTRWGWTVGGGAEMALGNGWSVKADYLYVHLASASYFVPAPVGFSTRADVPVEEHVFRLGVNYKFTSCFFLLSCGPLVAKY
jgi:outer membrane immunogenic protein